MTVTCCPRIVELESGAVVFIRAVNGKVFLQAPPGATLTRAEAEAVADALCLAGMDAEPPKSLQGLPRAKPITSVTDERVKGAPPPPEPPPARKIRSWP